MFTVIESPFFLNKTADFLDDNTRQTFINWIAMNPLAGDVIKGTGGVAQGALGLAGARNKWRHASDHLLHLARWRNLALDGLHQSQVRQPACGFPRGAEERVI